MRLSKFVSLLQVNKTFFCLSHSLRQQQIFGGQKIKNFFERFNDNKKNINVADLSTDLFGKVGRSFLSTLEKERFLVAEDDNESSEDYIPNPVIGPKNLNLLRILLTNRCNLNCKYCKVMPNIKNEMRSLVQKKF